MLSALYAIGAFLLSALLTWRLSQGRLAGLIAEPNERSLHSRPTPASGGLAIGAALIVGGAAVCALHPVPAGFGWLCGAGVLVALVSLFDDWKPLSPLTRLAAHGAAAYLLLVYGGFVPAALHLPGWQWDWPAWIGLALSFAFVVWMINLYNFMDGMDGFAGGMALFGFGSYALLGLLAGHSSFALHNLLVVASVAGFLAFNFPPAKIFMGDTGASLLGFLAAGFGLWGSREGVFPLWLAALIFSPFIADATVTLLRRLLRGEKVWQAHRTHYYQRLVQLGWGHRKTVLREYLVMAGCAASALAAWHLPAPWQWLLLALWAGVYWSLAWQVHRLESDRALGADQNSISATSP